MPLGTELIPTLCVEHWGWKIIWKCLWFLIFLKPHHIRANVNVEPCEKWEGGVCVCVNAYTLHIWDNKRVWILQTCQCG